MDLKKLKVLSLRIIESPFFILLLFAFFLFLRVYRLELDYSPLKRLTDVWDEGFWLHNARNMLVFGSWTVDNYNQALIGAPLFNFLAYMYMKFFGVGMAQSRLVSAISGWLTLITVFFIVKRSLSTKAAILTVSLLGFMNEFLMYNRIAFPESTQILFMTLTYLFWDLGHERSMFSLISGACVSLALLTKISAIYMLPAVILLWLTEYISGKFSIKNAALFCAGAALVMASWIVFLLNNYMDQIVIFKNGILGDVFQEKHNLLYTIVMFPNNLLFGLPSVVILVYMNILYFIGLFVDSFVSRVNKMSFAEKMSVAWIIGATLSLMVSPEQTDRRYVMFLPPLTILAVIAYLNSNDLSKSLTSFMDRPNTRIRWSFIPIMFAFSVLLYYAIPFAGSSKLTTLIIILIFSAIIIKFDTLNSLIIRLSFRDNISKPLAYGILLTSSYIFYLFAVATKDNLGKALIVLLLTIIYANMSKAFKGEPFKKTLIILMTMVILVLLRLTVENFLNDRFVMNDNSLIVFYVTSAFVFIYITSLLLFNGWLENVFKGFIISMFLLSAIFNGILYIKPSTSLYDISKYIGKVSNKEDIIIGPSAHVLAIENKTLPVRWSPYVASTAGINKELIQGKMYPKFLLLNDDWYNGYLEAKDKSILFGLPLGKKKIALIKRFPIAPSVFGGNWQTLNLLELKGSR